MDIEENYSDKKSTGYQVATLANKSAIKSMPNQQLADELHKPVLHIKTIFGVLIWLICN